MIRIIDSTDARAVSALVDRRPARDRRLESRVARIVERVRRDGDKALLAFALRFDRLTLPLEVAASEIDAGVRDTPQDVRDAIRLAARHIRRVARRQIPRAWSVSPAAGVRIEQRVTPLDRVGCYVPGGRYPLPSSMLMTAIPAAAAGVGEVVAVCPRPEPAVMAAALEAGVSRLFRLGGAPAIAALACGTPSVPRGAKVVGSGNRFVASAKALIAGDCGIDFFAGPTEILMVAARGPADWIAADLIAQAEHDPDARAVLVTPSRTLATRVANAVAEPMPSD